MDCVKIHLARSRKTQEMTSARKGERFCNNVRISCKYYKYSYYELLYLGFVCTICYSLNSVVRLKIYDKLHVNYIILKLIHKRKFIQTQITLFLPLLLAVYFILVVECFPT